MRPVLNRFFMSLRLGRDGYSMHALLPDGHHRQPTTTPSLTEFGISLKLLRARGVTVLADVTFSAMWTAQPAFSVSYPNNFNCLCCCGPQSAFT